MILALLLGSSGWVRADGQLDFGTPGVVIPPAVRVNGNTAQTVELLGQRALDAGNSNRIVCITDLGGTELPRAIPYLMALSTDNDPLIRAASARALAKLRGPRITEALNRLASDSDRSVRREAVRSAGIIGAGSIVTRALSDSDMAVLSAALGGSRSSAQAGEIAMRLPSYPPPLRRQAIQALGRVGSLRDAGVIASFLKDDVANRVAAINALGRLHATEYAAPITAQMRDSNAIVRRAVVESVISLASRAAATKTLINALSDDDGSVCTAAARELAKMPTVQALPNLVRALHFDDPPLHEAALRAIRASGPAAEGIAVRMLTDAQAQDRRDGSWLLGSWRSHQGFDKHLALLADSDLSVVAQAASSLGMIGDQRASEPLVNLINHLMNSTADGSTNALSAALVGCGRLRDSDVFPLAENIIAHASQFSPMVRASAAFAVGVTGKPPARDITTDLLLALANDPNQIPDVRMEALKALGNLKSTGAGDALAIIAKTEPDLRLRWMAHWAHDRATGKSTPFVVPHSIWTINTCITPAVPGQPAIEGVLSLGGYYRPGAWTPLRLVLTNGTSKVIHGNVIIPLEEAESSFKIQTPVDVPALSRLVTDTYVYLANDRPGHQLGTIDWIASSGMRVARGLLLGQPVGTARDVRAEWSGGKTDAILLCLSSHDRNPDASLIHAMDAGAFAQKVLSAPGSVVKAISVPASSFPRNVAGFGGCRYVLMTDADPDALDPAQRHALLIWIRSGGRLIIAAGAEDHISELAQSWLAPILPVQLIGWRESAALWKPHLRIHLKISTTSRLAEAVTSPGATLIAGNQDDAVAAYRPLSLGRIAFVAFTINALDPGDKATASLWNSLLGPTFPEPLEIHSTPTERAQVLQAMLGGRSIGWRYAIAGSGAYLLLVLLVHLVLGVGRRALAFVTIAIGGGLAAIPIALSSQMSGGDDPAMTGHAVLLDVCPSAGAVAHETIAFTGRHEVSLKSAISGPLLRPSIVEDSKLPVVDVALPSTATAPAGAHELKSIWESRGFLPEIGSLSANLQFLPSGANLWVDNELGGPLSEVALTWGQTFAMPTVVAGKSQSLVSPANLIHPARSGGAARDFAGARRLMRNLALAGGATALSSEPLQHGRPILVGSLGQANVPPALVDASPHGRVLTVAVVRSPVTVLPTPPGTTAKVDGSFMRLIRDPSSGLPYDARQAQWITSNSAGQWLIGFEAPAAIGQLRPDHAALFCDLELSHCTARFLRGQCLHEQSPAESPDGPVVLEINQSGAHREANFECGNGDFDKEGRVWLLMEVMPQRGDGAAPLAWRILDLSVSIKGTVTGAPDPDP